jgi:NADH dehydrogenase FAD-containing subunit
MSSQSGTVLVLCGGIDGVVTAARLHNQLPREHRVILIGRETRHTFSPSFPWLMVGMLRTETISRPRTKLTRLGFEMIQGRIEKIDVAQRSVLVKGQTLTGDYLVALRQGVTDLMERGLGLESVREIDQSKFSYLQFYDDLKGPNAHSVYREIEWE